MKNAIVYAVNNNEKYLDMMANSINSFYHFNPGLTSSVETVVLSQDNGLNLSKVKDGVPLKVVVMDNKNHPGFTQNKLTRFRNNCLTYRYELFGKMFSDYDNVLYLDCDTEIGGTLDELFVERESPVVNLIPGIDNPLSPRGVPKYGDLKCPTYYNSGVILATPRLIGETTCQQIYETLCELTTKFPQLRWPDQDALNAVFGMDEFISLVKPLPKTYNFTWSTRPKCTAKEARAATEYKIKHYVGLKKYDFRFI